MIFTAQVTTTVYIDSLESSRSVAVGTSLLSKRGHHIHKPTVVLHASLCTAGLFLLLLLWVNLHKGNGGWNKSSNAALFPSPLASALEPFPHGPRSRGLYLHKKSRVQTPNSTSHGPPQIRLLVTGCISTSDNSSGQTQRAHLWYAVY